MFSCHIWSICVCLQGSTSEYFPECLFICFFRIWSLEIWLWTRTVNWRSVLQNNTANTELAVLQSEMCEMVLRSWILVWRDTRRVKWLVMWWRAGTEHRRSSSTGCTTLRRVTTTSRQYQRFPNYLCLTNILRLSGRVVRRLHPGGDDHRPGALPRTRQYPHACCWWITVDGFHACLLRSQPSLPSPARSGIDQLTKILRLTGTPDASLVQKMQSKDVSFLLVWTTCCKLKQNQTKSHLETLVGPLWSLGLSIYGLF